MEFPALLESLPEMLKYIREQLYRFKIPDKILRNVELASEEALVNIISYAYPNSMEGKIDLICEKRDSALEIEIRDRGMPFNPLIKVPNLQSDIPLSERQIGGLGIFLMRELLDDVTYEYKDQQNVLKLSVHSPAPE